MGFMPGISKEQNRGLREKWGSFWPKGLDLTDFLKLMTSFLQSFYGYLTPVLRLICKLNPIRIPEIV